MTIPDSDLPTPTVASTPPATPQPPAAVQPPAAPMYGVASQVAPLAGYPTPAFGETPPPVKRKRPVILIITIVLLSLMLIGAAIALVMYYLQLDEANSRIDEQDQQIEEQQDLIDKKETFGAAMEQLLDTAGQLDGTLFGTIVPVSSYELTASREWTHRWDGDDIDEDIEKVNGYNDELVALIEAATVEAGSNSTGSVYETTIDSLGGGYVASLLYDADTFCESDVLACVDSADPYIVHFDEADNNVEYTNDFIRQGVAYHEFAHVLQITNPEATETALDAFGGDDEIMADCFALTYLDGWKLDHRIYVTSYSWWDVSIGYGYTCDDSQRSVIQTWYSELGYTPQPIEQ